MKYLIESEKARRSIIKSLPEGESPRDWVIAHLDMSAEPWTITKLCSYCERDAHTDPTQCRYYGSGVRGNEVG